VAIRRETEIPWEPSGRKDLRLAGRARLRNTEKRKRAIRVRKAVRVGDGEQPILIEEEKANG
jgi:hypothetical protein